MRWNLKLAAKKRLSEMDVESLLIASRTGRVVLQQSDVFWQDRGLGMLDL